MLDIYCERTAPGLWNEPLNLVSNLAFLLAAGVALAAYRRHAGFIPDRGLDLRLSIVWLGAIGIGSGLWHLTARSWAWWLDVVPIQLFMLTFLYSFMGWVLHWDVVWRVVALLGFVAVNVLVEMTAVGDVFNGSAGYFPAYALLLAMTGWLYHRQAPVAPLFGFAAGLLLLSLTFRSVDQAVCGAIPWGTHFLWHLLNAVVLGALLVAMVRVASSAHS